MQQTASHTNTRTRYGLFTDVNTQQSRPNRQRARADFPISAHAHFAVFPIPSISISGLPDAISTVFRPPENASISAPISTISSLAGKAKGESESALVGS